MLPASAQNPEEVKQQLAPSSTASGKLDTPISELQAAVRRSPNDKRAQFNLGLALVQRGRLREAIAPLQSAAQDPVLEKKARFLLGADYFESKQYAAAVRQLRGLEQSDNAERVLYMIEESCRRTGQIEAAKSTFHQLLTDYPDSAWTHYLMGTAYEDQQQFDKAIDEYKQALEKDVTIPNANFSIGYIYWRQQDTENAGEWLQKETLKGCHSLANYYLGEIARNEADLQKAESFYRRALTCDPLNSDAHLRLGVVLADEKRFKEAVPQLKEAIRLEPGGSSAHYHLASVYTKMGRASDAQAEYAKVRQIQAATSNGVDVTRGARP